MQEIEALVAHERRAPGTDAERRVARHLEGRLRSIGRDVAIEPLQTRPRWPLVHLLHSIAAIVGSLVAVSTPLAGTIVLGVVLLLVLDDLSGRLQLTRRVTGWRASQNVLSRESGDRPGTLVLVAHYDAGRTGAVFNDRAMRRRARIGRLLRYPISPFEPLVLAIVTALASALLRLAGIETDAVAALQFAAAVVLIVSVALLADLALSETAPGANDNASGVVTVLRLAERYGDELDNFDVWVLFSGAGEAFAHGTRAFLRRHGDELERGRTVFLSVDEVGAGTVAYTRREGLLLARAHNPALVDLCDQIAEEDAEDDDRYGARPVVVRAFRDAVRARAGGFAAITVSCLGELGYAPEHHQPTDLPDRIDPEALDRAFRFCSELIELIDDEIGPKLAG